MKKHTFFRKGGRIAVWIRENVQWENATVYVVELQGNILSIEQLDFSAEDEKRAENQSLVKKFSESDQKKEDNDWKRFNISENIDIDLAIKELLAKNHTDYRLSPILDALKNAFFGEI